MRALLVAALALGILAAPGAAAAQAKPDPARVGFLPAPPPA